MTRVVILVVVELAEARITIPYDYAPTWVRPTGMCLLLVTSSWPECIDAVFRTRGNGRGNTGEEENGDAWREGEAAGVGRGR